MILPMFDTDRPAAVRWCPNSFWGGSKPKRVDAVNWTCLIRNLLALHAEADERPVVIETELIDSERYNDTRRRMHLLIGWLFDGGPASERRATPGPVEMSGLGTWLLMQGVSPLLIGRLLTATRRPLRVGVFDQAGGHGWWGFEDINSADYAWLFKQFGLVQPIGSMFAGPMYLNEARLATVRGPAGLERWRRIVINRVHQARSRYDRVALVLTHTTLRRETGEITPEQVEQAYIGDDLWRAGLEAAADVGADVIWWQHAQAPVLERARRVAASVEPRSFEPQSTQRGTEEGI